MLALWERVHGMTDMLVAKQVVCALGALPMSLKQAADAQYQFSFAGGPQGMLIPPMLHLYRLRRQQWLPTQALKGLQQRKLVQQYNLPDSH